MSDARLMPDIEFTDDCVRLKLSYPEAGFVRALVENRCELLEDMQESAQLLAHRAQAKVFLEQLLPLRDKLTEMDKAAKDMAGKSDAVGHA
jgi:hypothetical protein